MSQAKLKLSNGSVILVEGVQSGVEQDVSLRAPINIQFDSVMPSIIGVCRDLETALKAVAPDRAAVEFGLSLKIETSGLVAVMTKGSVGANIKVTLEWGAAGVPPAVDSADA